MLTIAAIALLSAAAIAFCLCFLVALCRDSKPHSVAYWLRLRRSSAVHFITEPQEDEQSVTRVA